MWIHQVTSSPDKKDLVQKGSLLGTYHIAHILVYFSEAPKFQFCSISGRQPIHQQLYQQLYQQPKQGMYRVNR